MIFEMPAFSVVLLTGILLFEPGRFDGVYALKVITGATAVIGNMLCLIPVLKRRESADDDNLCEVIVQSKHIDRISILAIPAGLVALACGGYLMVLR